MIGRFVVTLGVLSVIGSCACGQSESEDRPGAAVATRDVIYFHRSRPVFLRLRLLVAGESFEAPWRRYVQSLFDQIDADQDGRLTPEETADGGADGTTEVLAILRRPDLWTADASPFDRAITLEELLVFLKRHGPGPFQPPAAAASARATAGSTGGALFDALDADADRLLAADEFNTAMRSLHRRDLDDDGVLSETELAFGAGVFPPRAVTQSQEDARPFVTLGPGTSTASVLRQLVIRYGPRQPSGEPGPGVADLNARDLGLDADVFARFDADASGRLDYDELRRLVRDPPPTLELRIRLGRKSGQAVEVVAADESSSVTVRRTSADLVSVVVDDVQIEIGELTSGQEIAEKYFVQQFRNADQDGNNYLEAEEVGRNSVFAPAFAEFDTDADGKVFEKEMKAVVEGRAATARSRTRMSVENRGRNLFQILDTDRNGSLTASELAAGARRIELWDENGDGAVAESEVPQLYRLALGPGQPDFRGVRIPGMPGARRAANRAGPAWYQKMDRNGDGELVRREFPGTRSEFDRLDLDGDGIVRAAEAIEVDQAHRQKTPPRKPPPRETNPEDQRRQPE